ncbi:MAG: hypothetical protein AAF907_03180 [Planctomycetota bacterium]
MTSRSFALSSLIAAIPGAALCVLIVMAILGSAGQIFSSIPLGATLVIALLCGVVVTIAPIILFVKSRGAERAAPAAAPAATIVEDDGGSEELFVADGGSDEILEAESGEFADGSSAEILADDDGLSDDGFGDSAEFVEADSAEFDEPDDDPFAEFNDDDDASDDDSFFDQPASK